MMELDRPIPLVDLDAQYLGIKGEILRSLEEVIETKAFVQGPWAEKFSRDFLKVHGGSYGIGCSNGTSAITLVLRALNIGPGDEVLLPNNTFFGSAEPIIEVGAKPVLVDIDADTYMMNLEELGSKVTSKTKAVLAVHLYGHLENVVQIRELCESKGIYLIEDCAQAHLARLIDRPVGTFGSAGTFSFYPGKNLGAYGDAGFVLTESEPLRKKVALLLDHGRTSKYCHEISGGNFRIDALQAAILSVKCRYVHQWTALRQVKAQAYDQELKPQGFRKVKLLNHSDPVFHLYVVEVSNRDEVLSHLKQKKIEAGIHYPIPLSQQPALAHLGCRPEEFPVSEKVSQTILSLPLFPELTSTQQEFIIAAFLKVARPSL